MTNEHNEPDKQEKKVTISLFKFIITVIGAIILTAAVTTFALIGGDQKTVDNEAPKRSEFIKLYQVYDTLSENYYKEIDKSKLIDSAIKGMVSGLDDPYSEYMTKEEQQAFSDTMSGDFQGIGAEISQAGEKIIITSPLKDSPAYKAGVKPNDELIAINSKSVEGMTTADVIGKIRGKAGTTVTLTLKRGGGEPFKVVIKRGKIHLDSVESRMLKRKTALITVTKFQEGTAEEFHAALKKMEQEGMEKLILDFRNNPGGYLEEAKKMAGEFIPRGDVLFYTQTKEGEPTVYNSDNPANPITKNLPTVIILNEGSASASEVFAAALRDNGKAKIAGTESFGKGIVQTATPYKDDSLLKFTQMKWLTPDKTWIHKKGIKPDKNIELPAYANSHVLNPDDVYTVGEKNSRVKSLEVGLTALGYHTGKVDTTFDSKTEAAVEKFQQDHKLKVTGQMHGKSTERFTELLRIKLEKNDPQLTGAKKMINDMK
ncbi:S41 family peptidase [Macrococcus carouselicus]|uniref:S41 family peptidase n=1 Tax=Macrococcus carouselicus TaxID=69969 RepID=UPI00140E413D|nr:S41 family peptidase [Macrococcus carouselicus]